MYFEILKFLSIQKLSFSGGTRMLFSDYAETQAMTVDFIDTTDIKQVEEAIKSNTKASSNYKTDINKCSKLHHFSKNNNLISFAPTISDDFYRNSIKSMFQSVRHCRYC